MVKPAATVGGPYSTSRYGFFARYSSSRASAFVRSLLSMSFAALSSGTGFLLLQIDDFGQITRDKQRLSWRVGFGDRLQRLLNAAGRAITAFFEIFNSNGPVEEGI